MALVSAAQPSASAVVALPPPRVEVFRVVVPIAAPRRSVVERFGGYTVLLAFLVPTLALALAVAVLRSPDADARMRAHAVPALVIAVAMLALYTVALFWLMQLAFALLAEVLTLGG